MSGFFNNMPNSSFVYVSLTFFPALISLIATPFIYLLSIPKYAITLTAVMQTFIVISFTVPFFFR